MILDKVFGFIVPKDKKFFPLFNQAADNLVNTSGLLIKLIKETDIEKREEYIGLIKDAEHQGDDITRILLEALNGTFITPFDREDIHELISNIDDVVDYIHSTSKRIHFYKVALLPEEYVVIAELIHSSTREIQHVLSNIKNVSDFQKFRKSGEKIRKYENQVDDIYQSYLSTLFEMENNAIDLIKKRDILASLEKAMDSCDNVAKTFSTIIIKIA